MMKRTILALLLLAFCSTANATIIHMATTGSDVTGTGTAGNPYAGLAKCLSVVVAGDTVYVHEGTYPNEPSGYYRFQGSPGHYILVDKAPGEAKPVFSGIAHTFQIAGALYGPADEIELYDSRYFELRNIIWKKYSLLEGAHNINMDDNFFNPYIAYKLTPLHHVIIDSCEFWNKALNCQMIKMAGVDTFIIRNSKFHGGLKHTIAIAGVGCHYGEVYNNTIDSTMQGGIEFKGGSSDIAIHHNYINLTSWSSVHLGGDSGYDLCRPDTSVMDHPQYEARNIYVYSNVFKDAHAPIFIDAARNCKVYNNLIYVTNLALDDDGGGPAPVNSVNNGVVVVGSTSDWLHNSPARNEVSNNVFSFEKPPGHEWENVRWFNAVDPITGHIPSDSSATFIFRNNLWYCWEDTTYSWSTWDNDGTVADPIATNNIFGHDPELVIDGVYGIYLPTDTLLLAQKGTAIDTIIGYLFKDYKGIHYTVPPPIGPVNLVSGSAPTLSCNVNPTTLSFAVTPVGSCTASQTFKIKNTGTVTLAGTVSESSADYEITAGSGVYSIVAGDSISVSVRFCPQSAGVKSISVQTGDAACVDVSCSGTGEALPACSITPATLSFGTVNTGACSTPQSFYISNSGGGTLSGTVSMACVDYEFTSTTTYSLGAGQVKTISVRFCPLSTGVKNCTIETGNAACADVSASGIGATACAYYVTAPATSASWVYGENQYITWTSSGAGANVKLQLYKGAVSQKVLYTSTPNDGTQIWSVSDYGGGTASDYRVRIMDLTDTTCVAFSGYFTITGPCSKTITAPGAVTWDKGSTQDITWTGLNAKSANVKIVLWKAGSARGVISAATSDDGTYSWLVDDKGGGTAFYTLKLMDASDTTCYDFSTQFAIYVEPAAVCTVVEDTLAFGHIAVGDTSTAQAFTITNDGGSVLAGYVSESSADFMISSGGGSYSLAAGEVDTVWIRFCPATSGAKAYSIETGSAICVDVYCTGTGDYPAAPVCSITPTTLTFETLVIGESSASQPFTIRNIGSGTLSGTVSESSPAYSITSGSGAYSLAAGQTRTVYIAFTPDAGGVRTGTIETGDALCSDVSCSGGGCTMTPATLAFSNTWVGSCSAIDSLTITNTGTGTISGTISASCPDFNITGGGGAYSLTAGQSRKIYIRFCPISTGTKSCEINF